MPPPSRHPPPQGEEPLTPNGAGGGGSGREEPLPDAAPYGRHRYRGTQDGGHNNPHRARTRRRGGPAHRGRSHAPRASLLGGNWPMGTPEAAGGGAGPGNQPVPWRREGEEGVSCLPKPTSWASEVSGEKRQGKTILRKRFGSVVVDSPRWPLCRRLVFAASALGALLLKCHTVICNTFYSFSPLLRAFVPGRNKKKNSITNF